MHSHRLSVKQILRDLREKAGDGPQLAQNVQDGRVEARHKGRFQQFTLRPVRAPHTQASPRGQNKKKNDMITYEQGNAHLKKFSKIYISTSQKVKKRRGTVRPLKTSSDPLPVPHTSCATDRWAAIQC
jgi:hypothetical protein